ncbi:MAG TPA: DUF5678 domain-containing protein [Pyrinomonadaceae bacterium]|nr:DUF5678 domain-containing protein [Pyrinomonadaceae bacterium]
MSIAIINEIIEKSAELTSEERRELIRLLHDQELEKQAEERAKRPKPKVNSNYVPSPNVIWLKENAQKYSGLYVALYEGELIATGRTIKEANLAAKAKGFPKTLLHKIMREDEEAWGGW